MRILNMDSDKPLERVTLYLTEDEAQQLKSYVEGLLSSHQSGDHTHLNDREFRREVTIAIYSVDDLGGFDSRSVKLIKTGA